MKRFRARYWVPYLFCGLCLSTACDRSLLTPGGAPVTMSLSIQAMCIGRTLNNGATAQAPADIYLVPHLATTGPLRAGDTVKIDYFLGAKKLGSGKAVWHDAMGPSPQNGRKFIPMIMARAGFGYEFCEWSNAPAGNHVVTARAAGPYGLTAVSAPLNITILP